MTREQQAVLAWAKTFAASPAESMIPRGLRLERWRWRYYRMCREIGLTRRELMVTPHSLRHGVLLDLYEQLLGQPAPVRGGELGELHPAAVEAVREVVAEYAGHSRSQISSAYLGAQTSTPRGVTSVSSTASTQIAQSSEELASELAESQ
jgi:integrase